MRAVCDRTFELPLTPEQALPLFTPEGERAWAGDDWDPSYAVARTDPHGSAPGTVFTTASTGGDATWIVVERNEDSFLYARVVPGHIAGTIRVTCSPDGDGCRVRVTYDVTSLGPEGERWLHEFESGYDDFLAHWRDAIVASLNDA